MANDGNLGPLGSDTNQPVIDGGTNCLTQCPHPPGDDGPQMYAYTPTPFERAVKNTSRWFSEAGEATNMLMWWLIGSPALGGKNGDLEYGPEDSETKHLRDTPAFVEAVEIYTEWIAMGRPIGQFEKSGISCEWVPSKDYFFVQGRTGGGTHNRPGKLSEPLAYPLWGYTGNFSIRFKEVDGMAPGYVSVEMENYTSLPSYLHGVDDHNPFLDNLYTRKSGYPILSRSRQVYRFITYIPLPAVAAAGPVTQVPPAGATHVVVAGDSLSGIAQKYYGDMALWPVIFNRNQATIGPDYNRLAIGQQLVLPALASLSEAELQQARTFAHRVPYTHPVQVAPLR